MILTRLLHKSAVGLLLVIIGALTAACNESDSDEPESPTPQIVFLFSPGGLGDMSYNDCILRGVQTFKKENPDIDLYIYSPLTIEEAERIFTDWLKRPGSDIPVLFVLASSDYEPMAEEGLRQFTLTPNKNILLFESTKDFDDHKVHTFQISMFGASYIAGAVAREASVTKPSLILLANPADAPIHVAKEGFLAGYGRDCDVEYLADDWTGYVAATLAYRNMSRWAADYGFIFPVAGGSNAGIYRYSREFEDSPLLAGMDIDQSGLSTKITGSVIKRIDRLIHEYLTEWIKSGSMPEYQLYGLESGYSDWQLSPLYKERFEDIVSAVRPMAITKEKEHNEIFQ